MQNAARIRVIDLAGLSEFIDTIENRIGLTAMARIAIPPDLAGMFAACEDAYERATREGYAENPAVSAAVTALRSAWKVLYVANHKLMMAEGFFHVEIAALRRDRACRATHNACVSLHAAIGQAAAENRLYNRCLVLAHPNQGSEKRPGREAVA